MKRHLLIIYHEKYKRGYTPKPCACVREGMVRVMVHGFYVLDRVKPVQRSGL
jgi:hypothetical protein